MSLGPNSLTDRLYRIHQLGGEILIPSDLRASQDNDTASVPLKIGQNTAPRYPSISTELVQLLLDIRYLTSQQDPLDETSNESHPACKAILDRLRSLKPEKRAGTLEETCIDAAYMFIHMILLRTPYILLVKCQAKIKLQEAMMQPRTEHEFQENREIVRWVATTAALAVGGQGYGRARARLVEKLDDVAARLEAVHII